VNHWHLNVKWFFSPAVKPSASEGPRSRNGLRFNFYILLCMYLQHRKIEDILLPPRIYVLCWLWSTLRLCNQISGVRPALARPSLQRNGRLRQPPMILERSCNSCPLTELVAHYTPNLAKNTMSSSGMLLLVSYSPSLKLLYPRLSDSIGATTLAT
jgi:hypothetical protein